MTETLICDKCGRKFTKRFNLNRHIKIHNLQEVSKKGKSHIICPLCYNQFLQSSILHEHLESSHEIKISCEEKVFYSEDDFLKWKEEIENNSKSLYCQSSVYTKGPRVIYFRCHRSGFFKSRSTGKRKASNKGSCKIDGYCPSRIVVRKSADRIEVRYYPTHVGHDYNVQFLHLSKTVEKNIANKLEQGESVDHILKKREEFIATPDSEEKQLINRKKLNNIRKKYKIPYIKNYCLNSTKSGASEVEDNSSSIDQQKKQNVKDESSGEETKIVTKNSDIDTIQKSGGCETHISSSNHQGILLPSNSYFSEEICVTKSDESHYFLKFNESVSNKLRQALHIVDTSDLKPIVDEDRTKIMSNLDEILKILAKAGCSEDSRV